MPIQQITTGIIANGAITVADVADATITGAKLAANTLANSVFQTGSVENYMRSVNLDFGLRNRIINGQMVIDQRNAGAAVTINSSAYSYPVDRFAGFGESTDGVFTLQQSSTAPAGFTNSLLATVTTADASIGGSQRYFIRQSIEGFNTADLLWGTADARPVTLSFWVRSSLTGTFGGSFMNENFDRAYPFSYTISAANTWEQKSITLAGDTTGTWLKTNGAGIVVIFSIGAGSLRVGTAGAWQTPSQALFGATGQTNIIATNGATWAITGVQLEEGSVPTPFEYRHYGTELQLCQRYYEQLGYGSLAIFESGTTYVMCLTYRTQKRAAASVGLTVTSNIRLRQFGTADRDATTASAGNVASSTTGASFKVSGFNSVGSTSSAACVCFTTSSEDGNLFFASAEL
jgi:hypothetical protein